jgi:DNA-binding IclR family transcriptional regulator
MTDDQRACLRELSQQDDSIPARALAKKLGWSQSTLFRCVASLEEQGLIAADDASDALSRRIAISDVGRRQLTSASDSQSGGP